MWCVWFLSLLMELGRQMEPETDILSRFAVMTKSLIPRVVETRTSRRHWV